MLLDGSIRLFDKPADSSEQPTAQTVLSEYPHMNLSSLEALVAPNTPLVPGETYFLTPKRAPSAARPPLTPPSRDDDYSADSARATSSVPSRAPPLSSQSEGSSLKAKVLATLAHFKPRSLRRLTSPGKKAAFPATQSSCGPSLDRDDVTAEIGFCESESAQDWADLDSKLYMMTDTRIGHRQSRNAINCARAHAGFAQIFNGVAWEAPSQITWGLDCSYCTKRMDGGEGHISAICGGEGERWVGCMEWQCMEWQCMDWQCVEWQCMEWQCMEWQCVEWQCVEWQCVEWQCVEWQCVEWQCVEWQCVEWQCMEWQCVEWQCVEWQCVEWQCVEWQCMEWQCVEWQCVEWQCMEWQCVEWQCVEWQCVEWQCMEWQCVEWQCVEWQCMEWQCVEWQCVEWQCMEWQCVEWQCVEWQCMEWQCVEWQCMECS
ncbi:unnamed protein product [Closterium sp. NIES-64]|nr:unnamed protein product [Closterium sp. NIES-64]